MSVQPPPLPASVGSQGPSTFARQAADACLVVPLAIIVVALCFNGLLHDGRGLTGRPLFVVFEMVTVGAILIGSLLGILAIVLARPGQRLSVIPRAVIGLLILGLLLAIAVPNFVRARTLALQNKRSLEEVRTAFTNVRLQAIASLTNGGASRVDAQPLLRSFDRAAEKTSGDTAALLKASQLHLERVQYYQHAYEQAASV